MKKLAIKGKIIDFSKIREKSVAQFKAQLKQNGIVLSERENETLYNQLQKIVRVEETKKQKKEENV